MRKQFGRKSSSVVLETLRYLPDTRVGGKVSIWTWQIVVYRRVAVWRYRFENHWPISSFKNHEARQDHQGDEAEENKIPGHVSVVTPDRRV